MLHAIIIGSFFSRLESRERLLERGPYHSLPLVNYTHGRIFIEEKKIENTHLVFQSVDCIYPLNGRPLNLLFQRKTHSTSSGAKDFTLTIGGNGVASVTAVQ